ncbi:ATP-dependent RNA helicase CHR1 [Candida viswanathii]|uniref:RNA helicase n=1 Tax=Candida viswanathii TaxID=5486 RepID=A0A367YBT5_9ASCO|nr:ATP-dependent RNA helicase CHR1 [Candida viswanathii]
MDIFRVLSRGASLNKKRGITTDYALPSEQQTKKQKHKQETLLHQVEKETDFFRTRKHTPLPTKSSTEKDQDDDEDEDDKEEEPVKGFDKFITDKTLFSNLTTLGFTEPTNIQLESIPIALQGKDVIVSAPTGSGKTLAYGIPLIQRIISKGGKGLIIAPTNELANQIYNTLGQLTESIKKVEVLLLTKKTAKNLSKRTKFDILISAPKRLIDVVDKEKVDLSSIDQLVLDEADKLFEGDFRYQTDEIMSHLSANPSVALYSATIPTDIPIEMQDPVKIKVEDSSSVEQSLVFTNESGKVLGIRQLVQTSQLHPPVLIFLQSTIRAKALHRELLYDGLKVDLIHGGLTNQARQEAIQRLLNGDTFILITTDVIARGVDFKGINLVINFDVPPTLKTYIHRIGRTGRAGRKGKAVTFFTKDDDVSAIKKYIGEK